MPEQWQRRERIVAHVDDLAGRQAGASQQHVEDQAIRLGRARLARRDGMLEILRQADGREIGIAIG